MLLSKIRRASAFSSGAVAAALAVSGCGLLLFALFHRKLTVHRSRVAADSSPKPAPSAAAAASSAKKKVRFSEEVQERRAKKREFGRQQRRDAVMADEGEAERQRSEIRRERKSARVSSGSPANRSVLYNGILRYRSQMTTLMMYAG